MGRTSPAAKNMAKLSTMKTRMPTSLPVMGAAGAPPPPSDVSTFWYVVLALLGLVALRIAPFAAEPSVPASLLRFDDAHASLYALVLALMLLAYLPAATALAHRGGGSPVALVVSVVAFFALSAPLEAMYRTQDDASATPRRVLTYLVFGSWLASLSKDERSLVWAIVFLAAIVVVDAVAADSGAIGALEISILTILHYRLAAAPLVAKEASHGAWFVIALLLGLPVGVAALTPLLLVGGHMASDRVAHRLVNHHGAPFHDSAHETLYPANVSELQAMVRAHAFVAAHGAGHSWSALAAPSAGGKVVSTELLRAISYDNLTHVLTAGAGATFGTAQSFLHRRNRQLRSNWHGAVTFGGAVATGVQHLGVGISELCVSVDLVLADGSLRTVDAVDARFPMVFGSAGLLGVVTSVRVQTIERAELRWDSVTEPYADAGALNARVGAWAADASMRSSVLWVVSSLRETTIQLAALGPPLPAPAHTDAPQPYLPKRAYGTPGLSFALYANFLAIALVVAEPLVRSIATSIAEAEMRAFIREYTASEVSLPHLPMDAHDDPDNDVLPLRLSTVEVDVSVDGAHLPGCVETLATAFAYPIALHVRAAQATELPVVTSGASVFHVDLSFSLPLLGVFDAGIRRAIEACPEPLRNGHAVSHAHAGKLALADLLERRLHRPVKAARLPGRSGSAEHAAFRALVSEWDPHGKFTPVQ